MEVIFSAKVGEFVTGAEIADGITGCLCTTFPAFKACIPLEKK
jgi:hypothetical protein